MRSDYHIIITRLTRMSSYVSRRPNTHTFTYEQDEVGYWKQMGMND